MLDELTRSTRDRLLRLVLQLLSDPSGARQISPEAPLTEIGLSSIDMVNLMLEVEAEFDVTIPQSDITPDNFRSIATIEGLVLRLAQPTHRPQICAAPAAASGMARGGVLAEPR